MREQFKKQGLGVAAISYDSREILRHFAERASITFPLLSDPDSEAIKAFGILNDNFKPGQEGYGIPFPGTYVIDETGKVRKKYFEQNHRQRYALQAILIKDYRVANGQRIVYRTNHLTLTAYSSQTLTQPGNTVTLALDIKLPRKMHLYAPGVQGYRPVSFSLDAPPYLRAGDAEYPKAKILKLAAIKESVPVYKGSVRITRDVTLSSRYQESKLEITGTFRYQACDEKVCYVPAEIPLKFTFDIAPNDTVRVPKELRREP